MLAVQTLYGRYARLVGVQQHFPDRIEPWDQ